MSISLPQACLTLPDGGQLVFDFLTRNQADKRFLREERMIEAASDTEAVPIEILFHPFYLLGHTSLRIGRAAFELGHEGWRFHGDGCRSARAFLYHNPFFRRRSRELAVLGVPPFSIGATVKVTRRQAEDLRNQARCLASNRGERAFHVMKYNCNHGIWDLLAATGVPGAEPPSGFRGFSSVLTFRRLIRGEAEIKPISLAVYPLPSSGLSAHEVPTLVPSYLSNPGSSAREFFRLFHHAISWRRAVVTPEKNHT